MLYSFAYACIVGTRWFGTSQRRSGIFGGGDAVGGLGGGGYIYGRERGQSGLAPFDRGAELRLAEAEGKHPVGESGVLRAIGASHGLQLFECGEDVTIFFLEVAKMGDGDAWRRVVAKEELEEKLVAGRVFSIGKSEPTLEADMAGRGQRVFLAV